MTLVASQQAFPKYVCLPLPPRLGGRDVPGPDPSPGASPPVPTAGSSLPGPQRGKTFLGWRMAHMGWAGPSTQPDLPATPWPQGQSLGREPGPGARWWCQMLAATTKSGRRCPGPWRWASAELVAGRDGGGPAGRAPGGGRRADEVGRWDPPVSYLENEFSEPPGPGLGGAGVSCNHWVGVLRGTSLNHTAPAAAGRRGAHSLRHVVLLRRCRPRSQGQLTI